MIKGVNKRIIEIKNTDSPYFERAVFYLRPHVLDDEAAKFIAMIMPECKSSAKYRHKYLQAALGLAAALVTIILLLLF